MQRTFVYENNVPCNSYSTSEEIFSLKAQSTATNAQRPQGCKNERSSPYIQHLTDRTMKLIVHSLASAKVYYRFSDEPR